MAKYVQFNFEDKEPEYYNVDDFSLETIKKLPSYNEKWFKMTFLDGKKRMFDGKILDIYPATLINIIYNGKRVSYEETKRIVESDLKYKDLLWSMDTICRNNFSSLGLNFTDEEGYSKQLKSYQQDFDKNHFCLFTLPNNFSASFLEDEKAMTIEDFDSSIKLDYAKDLKNIAMNAAAGQDYLKENQFTMELFKNYFDMLRKFCKAYPKDIQEGIFCICYFHFEHFNNLKTLEEINFFLDICDYTYGFTNGYGKELFNCYREYINEQYKELENEENFGLV